MKCEVSQTNDVENSPGKLRISRFYDITHEPVVTPATYFGIHVLRKCSIKMFVSSYPTFLFH